MSIIFQSDMAGYSARAKKALQVYMKNFLAAGLRSTLQVTLPNNIKTARANTVSQQPVKDLQKRITADIVGSDGQLRKAAWNKYANGWTDFEGNGGNAPLVIPKGRFSGNRVDAYKAIKAGTRIARRQGYKAAHRYALPGQELQATTAASWRAAEKRLRNRAGNFLAGWSAAAQAIGSKNLSKFLPKKATVSRSGEATEPRLEGGKLNWSAVNNNAAGHHAARYTQTVLRKRLAQETAYYAKEFKQYMLAALQKKSKAPTP